MNFKSIRAALDRRIEQAISDRVFSGCVVGFFYGTTAPSQSLAYGRFDYTPDAPVVSVDTVFDVASVTKSIPVGTLALYALSEGLLELTTPVIEVIPEVSGCYCNKINILHLLTHTLDFGFSLSSFKNGPPEAILEKIYSLPLRSPPGSTFFYSNSTSILLGIALERVLGDRLDRLADRIFFNPLDMYRTTFSPGRLPADEIMPTEEDPWRGQQMRGVVHDESAWVLQKIMVPGSAGLFSTVPDLLTFLRFIAAGAYCGTRKIIGESVLNMLTKNFLAPIGATTTIGWELNRPVYMGTVASSQTIGKTGFTGSVVMLDLSLKAGLAMLSNYTFPSRKPDASLINAVRRDVADTIFGHWCLQ